MAQTPKEVQQIGLVDGPSKTGPDAAQTPEAAAFAAEVAVDTAEQIGRTSMKNQAVVTLSDGREVACRTAKVGQIGLVLRFLMKVSEKLEVVSVKPEYLQQKLGHIAEDPQSILLLLMETEEFVWPLVAALTSLRGEAEVKVLELDDAVLVGRALFALNKDFFLQRVLPLFLGKLAMRETQQG